MMFGQPVAHLPHQAGHLQSVELFILKERYLLSLVELMFLESAHDAVLLVGKHPAARLVGALL